MIFPTVLAVVQNTHFFLFWCKLPINFWMYILHSHTFGNSNPPDVVGPSLRTLDNFVHALFINLHILYDVIGVKTNIFQYNIIILNALPVKLRNISVR